MEKFITHTDTAVPLEIENIDTDQIIPARFLKATNKEGFGENLFKDWRFDAEGKLNKNFILNDPAYKGSILVTGDNFGCGSSREHAAWALKAFGFKVVVSSYFGDIFKGNALNNGILPVMVSPVFLQKLFRSVKNNSSEKIEVDLQNQVISIISSEASEKFEIDPYKKTCMINGFDDIDYLLNKKEMIKKYENQNQVLTPVAYAEKNN